MVPYTSNTTHIQWNKATSSSIYLVTIHQTFSNGSILGNQIVKKVVFNEEIWVNLAPNLEYTIEVQAFTRYDVCTNTNITTTTVTTADWMVSVQEPSALSLTSKIYPNPVGKSDVVFFEINSTKTVPSTISIYNALEQVMLPAQAVKIQSGTHLHQLDVSSLAAGVYFIQLSHSTQQINHKLVIQE